MGATSSRDVGSGVSANNPDIGVSVQHITTVFENKCLDHIAEQRQGNAAAAWGGAVDVEACTVGDAVLEFVKPLTDEWRCSYAEYLACHAPSGKRDVGVAHAVLSYTWGYPLRDVVSALQNWVTTSGRDPTKTYVWICALCINQHNLPVDAVTVVQERISSIGLVLSMMTLSEESLFFQRLWCNFELWVAHRSVTCDVHLVFTTADANQARHALSQPDWSDRVEALVGTVNLSAAETTDGKDSDMITEVFERHGGTDYIENELKTALHQMLLNLQVEAVGGVAQGNEVMTAGPSNSVTIFIGYSPKMFHPLHVVTCELLHVSVNRRNEDNRNEILAKPGTIPLSRRGPAVFGSTFEIPDHEQCPLFLKFDLHVVAERPKRSVLSKNRKSSKRRITARIDASRVLFFSIKAGDWHTSMGYNAGAAYETFLPGILSTVLGLTGIREARARRFSVPKEIERLHLILLSYLDSEGEAFKREWLKERQDGDGTAPPSRPLSVGKVIRAFNGGFAASPPCLEVARTLAEASVLAGAGMAWDEFCDNLLMKLPHSYAHQHLHDCMPDLQALAEAPTQLELGFSRANFSREWPLLEALTAWLCIGMADRTLRKQNDGPEKYQLAIQFEATMSLRSLSSAVHDGGVLETWSSAVEDIKRGCTVVALIHSQPHAQSFSWLEVAPALHYFKIVLRRPPAHLENGLNARARKYAETVSHIDLIDANALDSLKEVLFHAPTLASATDLIQPFLTAISTGSMVEASDALLDATATLLEDYSWPLNSRVEDTKVMHLILTTRGVHGIALFSRDNGALFVRTLNSMSNLGLVADENVVKFASDVLKSSTIENSHDIRHGIDHINSDTGLIASHFSRWASSRTGDNVSKQLRLFSGVLRCAFPDVDGFEALVTENHTAYSVVLGEWRTAIHDILREKSSKTAFREIPRSLGPMDKFDDHDWVCFAQVAYAMSEVACQEDVAPSWIFDAFPTQIDQPGLQRQGGLKTSTARRDTFESRRKNSSQDTPHMREEISSIVYVALADATDRKIGELCVMDSAAEIVLEFANLLNSPRLTFFLDVAHFVLSDRSTAMRNVQRPQSPLNQIARAFPGHSNVWERLEVSIRPLFVTLTDSVGGLADGSLSIAQFTLFRDSPQIDLLTSVAAVAANDSDLETRLQNWTEAERHARDVLQRMIDAAAHMMPDAEEVDVLRRVQLEWHELATLSVDVILAGDGTHESLSEIGKLVQSEDESTEQRFQLETIRGHIHNTALDSFLTHCGGLRALRMLSWLGTVRDSPVFTEMSSQPILFSTVINDENEEEDQQTVRLTVPKRKKSLGLSFSGSQNPGDGVGVFVSDIADSSVTAETSIFPGVRILSVNGQNMTEASQPDCATIFERVKSGMSVEVTYVTFSVFRASENSSRLEEAITTRFQQWRRLYTLLCTGDISFGELGPIGAMLKTTELDCIATTASIGSSWSTWRRNSSAQGWATARVVGIEQYLELDRRRCALDLAITTTDALKEYLENQRNIAIGLRALQSSMRSKWTNNTLTSLGDMLSSTDDIDIRLMDLPPGLIRAIAHNRQLLQWMREALGSDFQQSIEIVSGLSEAQCPDDLWDERDKKLGSLSEVRQQLQTFVYREHEKFQSLSKLTDALVEVSEQAVQHINICGELYVPFTLAFSNDPDSVAPRRLTMFRESERQANWCIGWNEEHINPTVLIQYRVRRRRNPGLMGRIKTLELHELEDFQSSLVLVQTVGDEAEQEMIEEFIHQYQLALKVKDVMERLRESGHFDYQSTNCELRYRLDEGLLHLREDLQARTREIDEWEMELDRTRRQCFALNAIPLRLLWDMVRVVEDYGNLVEVHQRAQMEAHFAAMLELVVPENGLNARRILENGLPLNVASSNMISAGERLHGYGSWLNSLVCNLQLRRRTIDAADLPVGSGKIRRDVNLAVCGSTASPLMLALSIFTVAGWLPEREELLLCNPETPWEAIRNFLYRWELAEKNNRRDRIFVVCGLDNMPFAVQSQAAKVIRNAVRSRPIPSETGFDGGTSRQLHLPTPPLVVVVNSEVGHIVSELAPYRVLVLPLPSCSACANDQNITVVSSPHSGAGKSFSIRTQAAKSRHTVAKVPIHCEVSSAEFIQLLRHKFGDEMPVRVDDTTAVPSEPQDYSDLDEDMRRAIQLSLVEAASQSRRGHSGLTCHIDITRRIGSTVEAALFELLVFGSLVDPVSGEHFIWARDSTNWAIEIASDVSMKDLPFLSILPQRHISVTPESFLVDSASLERGMGDDFTSSRFDGSIPNSSEVSTFDAHARLQRVVCRLKAIQSVDLDAVATVIGNDQPRVTSNSEAFRLLVQYSGQNEATASLTALWAFINVMFWQLFDLDHDDCVVRSVMCVLDERRGRGRWFQLKLSELIALTARDFAPRCAVTPSDGVAADPHERGLAQIDGLVKWRDSNHQCILFQHNGNGGQAGGGVSFLAVNYEQLTVGVGAQLQQIFEQQRFNLRPTEEQIVDMAPTIFSIISGVSRTSEEARGLMGGSYVMTNDNLLKMIAVFVRVRCGVPVVLMGECGCGKTLLMQYICAFLNVRLITLNVHGGTTADDVFNIFAQAEIACEQDNRNVWVFLDEVNTSAEIGLLTEAILHRSLNGRALHSAIQVVGAVNPYRRKPAGIVNAGLEHADVIVDHELSDLVYRVHPLPASLLASVFDFGHLDEDVEAMYIRVMVMRQFPQTDQTTWTLLTAMIHKSQEFIRRTEREPSAVSLRDVRRCLDLIVWFSGPGDNNNHQDQPVVKPTRKTLFNHVQFAAERKLDWPCPDDYSQYVATVIVIGVRVRLLEQHVGLDVPVGETGIVRSLDGIEYPMSAEAVVRFTRSGSATVDARLPLSFLQVLTEEEDDDSGGPSNLTEITSRSIILALAHVYYFRLSDSIVRTQYFDALSAAALAAQELVFPVIGSSLARQASNLRSLLLECSNIRTYSKVIDTEQRLYCSNMIIDAGIAQNQALSENVFVVIVSICNRIPVFIVGRPGTSKSLSLSLIASNLRGEQSTSPFFRRFPAVHVVPYQCSPHSTADSIIFQYRKAVEFASSRGQDSLTVLLLDEVGLAELSPDLPLKVLHEMLVDPPIAIVGISNWVLDPAKMNRACILQRPDPGEGELSTTAQAIAETDTQGWLSALSQGFHEVYSHQGGRPWIGMRDFYSLIKAVRRAIDGQRSGSVAWPIFLTALCRNFGGKPEVLKTVLRTFRSQLNISKDPITLPSALTLIRENLEDPYARHLMLLTENGAALHLLFQCGVVTLGEGTRVLIGSSFSADASEYHLISQINSIKRAMQVGQHVILFNCGGLYEALYDVLNQAYVTRTTNGKVEKFLRLAVGKRSQLCPVHDSFRLIIVTEKEHAYNNLDLPLLNRVEKQLLQHTHVCEERQLSKIVEELTAVVSTILQECGNTNVRNFLPGFNESTVASLALATNELYNQQEPTSPNSRKAARKHSDIIRDAGVALARCATPLAFFKSTTLRKLCGGRYEDQSTGEIVRVQVYNCFLSYLEYLLESTMEVPLSEDNACKFALVLTRSPSAHLETALSEMENQSNEIIDEVARTRLQLADFESERAFETQIEKYFTAETTDETLLIIQCDPFLTPPQLIDHARYLCEVAAIRSHDRDLFSCSPDFQDSIQRKCVDQASRIEAGLVPLFRRYVVFVLHVPLGISRRVRDYPLTFESEWDRVLVDDLIEPSTELSTINMLRYSVLELTETAVEYSISAFLRQHFIAALAIVIHPQLSPDDEKYLECLLPRRIDKFRKVLQQHSAFVELLADDTREILRNYCERECIDNVQAQVRIAMKDAGRLGTLRLALAGAINTILHAAAATAIARFDRNYNVRLLNSEGVPIALWLALASLRHTGSVDMKAVEDPGFTVVVKNDGSHDPCCCEFPFSFALLNAMKDQQQSIEEVKNSNVAEHLNRMLRVKIGDTCADQVDRFFEVNPIQAFTTYVNDFVAQAAPVFSSLTANNQAVLYRAVLMEHEATGSVGAIHAGLTRQESRIFLLCTVLDVLSDLRRPLLNEVVERLEDALRQSEVSEEVGDSADSLSLVDAAVFEVVVMALSDEASSGTFGQSGHEALRTDLILWRQLVGQLRPYVRQFWTHLSDEHAQSLPSFAQVLLQNWIRVETYSLIASVVMLPTIGLFEAEIVAQRQVEVKNTTDRLQREIERSERQRDYMQERLRGWGWGPTEDIARINREIARIKRDISEVKERTMVNLPIREVVDALRRVLANVQEQHPFEADTVFLVLALMSDALRVLLSERPDFQNLRLSILQRFVHRFFVELVCQQPREVWPESMYSVVADFAVGAARRLDPGLLTPALQIALLHHVFDTRNGFRLRASLISAAAATENTVPRFRMVEYFENRYDWMQFLNSTASVECEVCYEDRQSSDMVDALCGHAVCHSCVSSDNSGALRTCYSNCPGTVYWQGPMYLNTTSSLLETSETQAVTEGSMLLEKVRAVGLARFVLRHYVQGLMAQFDAETAPGDPTAVVLHGNVTANFVNETGCEAVRNFCLSEMVRRGGPSYFHEFLRNGGPLLPWFEPEGSVSHVEVAKIPFDPFVKQTSGQVDEAYVLATMKLAAAVVTRDEGDLGTVDVSSFQGESVLAILFTGVHCTPPYVAPDAVIQNMAFGSVRGCARFARGLANNFVDLPAAARAAISLLRCDSSQRDQRLPSSLLKVQVLTHIVRLALKLSDSWYGALLNGPLENQQRSHLPSMPEDELSMIIRATTRGNEAYADLNARNGGINGSVWYKCKNGHPYSVGQCGKNIVQARCPCGAVIGGRAHNTDPSNTQIRKEDLEANPPGTGYMPFIVRDENGDSLDREISPLGARVLRLILHGLLLVRGLECSGSSQGVLAQFVLGKPGNVTSAIDFLAAQFVRDWDALRNRLDVSEENVALFSHLVLNRTCQAGSQHNFIPARCDTAQIRQDAENAWERFCLKPITQGTAGHLDNARQDFKTGADAGGPELLLKTILGEARFDAVVGPKSRTDPCWKRSEPLSLEGFHRAVSNADVSLPGVATLRKFLEVEPALTDISHLPSVLSWHAYVFQALEGGVTRAQARDMKNADLIQLLPEHAREGAREAFSKFQLAWNALMPKIDILFECQENPYRDGSLVGHIEMTETQQLMFSLPNVAKGQEGLECTCTIAMLNHLQMCNNSMLLEFRKAVSSGESTEDEDEATSSPIVNYLTSPKVVAQKLLAYDRMTHLFPILLAHSRDSGQGREFDLKRIAAEVEQLFEGKSTIAVHCRHFTFNGELQKMGLLAKLGLAVPQVDLPADAKARIADELDTQQRCSDVMLFLERCIRIVASIGTSGGGGVNGDMRLEHFVLEVLAVDPEEWAEKRTPALAESVQLSTLGSTYSHLEECLGDGNPLETVLPEFKEELTGEALAETQVAMGNLDLPALLPAFRNFLDRLRDDSFAGNPAHPLKLWLGNESVDGDNELQDLPWYDDHFPELPTMATAVATFRALRGDS